MILANFDLSFFTSIPGMLITGGVLLLLIALIIFIATGSKKGKKDKKEEIENVDNDTVATTPTVDMNVATEPNMSTEEVNTTVETPDVISAEPAVEDAPQIVVTSSEAQMEPISIVENNTPVVNEENNQNLNQTVEPNTISNEEVNPQVEMSAENVDTTTTGVDENINVNADPVVITSDVNNAGQTNEPIDTMASVNQESNEVAEAPAITIVNEEPKEDIVMETSKQIYGGTDPVIPKIEVEGTEHRPIYGGANPLENTGAIPTINSNTVETATLSTTPEVPRVEPEVEMPKVEPEVVNVATVDNTPTNNVEPITPIQEEKTKEQVVIEKPKEEVESLF